MEVEVEVAMVSAPALPGVERASGDDAVAVVTVQYGSTVPARQSVTSVSLAQQATRAGSSSVVSGFIFKFEFE